MSYTTLIFHRQGNVCTVYLWNTHTTIAQTMKMGRRQDIIYVSKLSFSPWKEILRLSQLNNLQKHPATNVSGMTSSLHISCASLSLWRVKNGKPAIINDYDSCPLDDITESSSLVYNADIDKAEVSHWPTYSKDPDAQCLQKGIYCI